MGFVFLFQVVFTFIIETRASTPTDVNEMLGSFRLRDVSILFYCTSTAIYYLYRLYYSKQFEKFVVLNFFASRKVIQVHYAMSRLVDFKPI